MGKLPVPSSIAWTATVVALGLGCLCLIPCGGLTAWWFGAGPVREGQKLAEEARDNNGRTLDELVEAFRKRGLSVEKIEPAGFDRLNPPIRADWRAVWIEGQWIHVAKYDRNNPEQKESLQDLQHGRRARWFLGQGESLEFNGSFILGNADRHPKSRRIEEVFRAF